MTIAPLSKALLLAALVAGAAAVADEPSPYVIVKQGDTVTCHEAGGCFVFTATGIAAVLRGSTLQGQLACRRMTMSERGQKWTQI